MDVRSPGPEPKPKTGPIGPARLPGATPAPGPVPAARGLTQPLLAPNEDLRDALADETEGRFDGSGPLVFDQTLPKPPGEEDPDAREANETGDKIQDLSALLGENRLLDHGGKLANLPGSALHLTNTIEQLLDAPLDPLKDAFNDPLHHGLALVNEVKGVQEDLQTLKQTVKPVVVGGRKIVTNLVREGMVQGGAKTWRDATDGLKARGTKLRRDFAGQLRGGRDAAGNKLLKDLDALAERVATKKAEQRFLSELMKDPALRPRGLGGRLRQRLTRLQLRVEQTMDRVAEWAERRVVKPILRTRVGQATDRAITALTPKGAGVPAQALDRTVEVGARRGVPKGLETVYAKLEQQGVSLTRGPTGEVTRLVSKTGQEVPQAALRDAERLVAKESLRTTERGFATGAKKLLGRFLPGLNYYMAVQDTRHMAEVWRDPKAGLWKKSMATVTAAGSWLAATNIPPFAQIGGLVSIVGGILENPRAFWQGCKAAARTVVRKVGTAIKTGVKKVGAFFKNVFGSL